MAMRLLTYFGYGIIALAILVVMLTPVVGLFYLIAKGHVIAYWIGGFLCVLYFGVECKEPIDRIITSLKS